MNQAATAPLRYVAFDLETTGLSAKSDRILEIAAVAYDSALNKVDELEIIVDPGMPIPLAIQRLVGLSDAEVRGAPVPEEGIAQLADFCEGAALVAHAGAFDLAFCASILPEQFSHPLLFDTLELARVVLPTQPSHSLPRLGRELGLDHRRPHRALSDAAATGELFIRLVRASEALPGDVLGELRRVARQAPGPIDEFFSRVVSGSGGSGERGGDEVSRERASRRRDGPSSQRSSRQPDADEPLDRAAARLLGPHGLLAASEGYEHRESQQQMARAVGQTLERRGRLMVEAGTGVGKSLAYVVPLALWASRGGGRAVIATHTITLQEQLVNSDLPTVMGLLDRPVTTAMLKGRNHYISLRRWQRWLAQSDVGPHGPDLDVIRFKLKLLVWLAATTTGDRAELHLGANDEPLWQRVASDTDDCLGRACANWSSGRCHMVASRRAAADAALVVTNHAVLLADAERQGQVLAPYEALVVDEAHHLEAAATEQLGVRVRAGDLAIVLDRLPPARGDSLTAAVAQCREASQRLFGDAKGFLVEALGGPGNGTVGLSEAVRGRPQFEQVLRSARHAVGVLHRAAQTLLAAQQTGAVQEALLPQPERSDDELELASLALSGIAAAIDVVVSAPRPDHVAWLEMRAEQAELRDAPTSVASALREHVFSRAESTVLTSATMAVAGSFDFVRSRLGIGDGAEELVLPSPFDYLSQALCLLATDVPPYDEPDHDGVIAALVESVARRLGGRTLVLFTGYGPLKRVHALLGSRLEALGIAVLGQGLDGTRGQILQSFLDDANTVLLGTSSFWEGVDLPGDALQCVVIDKLPFAVPTDPLVGARTGLLADPFGQYILPMAVLRLKQGFGRLIRGQGDRGAVVLCDPRLDSRDYGPRFLEALPPAAFARQPASAVAETVEEFVRRGVAPQPMGQSEQWSWSDSEPA